MFIVTAHLPKKRLITLGAALLCCFVAVVTGFICLNQTAAVATGAKAEAEVKGIRTNEDRIAYLEGLGWDVGDDAVSVEELLIPEEFDQSYDEYLALQANQGFDLAAYSGKRVKRYTYEILNYPSGETGVQAALLIHKNTIIGGEVLSLNPDGFLHGLEMPS